ncbi:MAG: hypothetical protein RL033_7153 [Pseudomonadota bacterium]|jgi:hypothetical protein
MVSGIRRGLGVGLGLLLSSVPAAAQSTSPAPVPAAAAATPAATPSAAPAQRPAPAGPAAAASAPVTKPSPLNPAPAEFPGTTPALGTPQLDALFSRMAALRSRIAALTSALFSSKLRIEVRAEGEGVQLQALHVSVDGGVVYTAPPRAGFEQPEVVYEHAVAPGPHVVSIEVERRDALNPQFSTWQESRFVVLVPEKKSLWTRLELEDESNMAEDFAEEDEGQYQLRVKLLAEVNE